MFSDGAGDQVSIPDRVIPKIQEMVLYVFLLNTQYYKVRIKSKMEQSRERNSALPYTLGSPSTMVANFTLYIKNNYLKLKLFQMTIMVERQILALNNPTRVDMP